MHVKSMESLTPRRGPTPRLNCLCLHRSAWKHWQVRHRSMGVPLYRWMVYKGKSQSKMDWLSRENLHRKPWIFSHEDHGRFSGSKRFPKPIHWNIRHQISYKVVTVTTKYVFNCYPTDGLFIQPHATRNRLSDWRQIYCGHLIFEYMSGMWFMLVHNPWGFYGFTNKNWG